MVHIIHSGERHLRYDTLMGELERQGIREYTLWPAIFDRGLVQRGVSQAHKQIVRWAQEKGLSEVTIMEDDVKFPAVDGFNYYLRSKPDDFDLYLGGIYRGEIREGKVSDFSSLHLYTVKAKFYGTFLSVDETKHLDTGLAGLGDYHVCCPFAAIQHNGWSDVQREYQNFESLIDKKQIYDTFKI